MKRSTGETEDYGQACNSAIHALRILEEVLPLNSILEATWKADVVPEFVDDRGVTKRSGQYASINQSFNPNLWLGRAASPNSMRSQSDSARDAWV